jgi:hypothetical protein
MRLNCNRWLAGPTSNTFAMQLLAFVVRLFELFPPFLRRIGRRSACGVPATLHCIPGLGP